MARIPKPNIRAPQLETFHQSHATNAVYNALPGPVTLVYSLIVTGSVTGLAYFLGDAFGDGKGLWWMYGSMAVMTVIGLVLMLFRVRKAKKSAASREGFEEAVKGSAGGWDAGGGSDPAEIARLDNLRKQFQKGIDTFKEYGKDFYSLPWYVMVGEPGSGKTEAIRHSDLRFPETLQDMLQGTGGTYSMDWWFTNQAVLLDTAGAMLMNPEATKRFEEFLKLLRTYRPDCPVNGVILAIPVDSLLADTPSVLEEKAKRIAQQFAIIQKALDVRFPIYLMVTKSDRLPGFREFTDAPGQHPFDREMLGWSNPADLDAEFHPDHISGALDSIATRLEGRRLALLADPIARQPENRRVDEVDSLFTFPETVRSLQPRLQRYMEILFQTGIWSTMPPFFRGVYFTSAMNEGAALDEQLASALGMSIETLPGGGIFNRDKSVYLRDVFTEKIFKERGLVTRLKDVSKALRRKLFWFYLSTALILLGLLGFAWLVKRGVEKQLRIEQENWRVANSTWGNGGFLPIVTRAEGMDAPDGKTKNPPRWTSAWSSDGAQLFKEVSLTRLEFLADLEHRTAKGLPGAGIFRMMGSIRDFERRRRVACLAVYEGSVFKPLLDGVREKIVWDAMPNAERDPSADKRLANAYAALVRLEVIVLGKDGTPDAEVIRQIIEPMMLYLCPPDAKDPNTSEAKTANAAVELSEIGERLYKDRLFGEKGAESLDTRGWLGTSASAAAADPALQFAGVQALTKGIDTILGNVADVAVGSEDEKKGYQSAKEDSLSKFAEVEKELADLTPDTATMKRVGHLLDTLKGHLADVENMQKKLGEATRVAGLDRNFLSQFCTSLENSLSKVPASDIPAHLAVAREKEQLYLKKYGPPVSTSPASSETSKPEASPAVAPEVATRQRYEIYRKRLDQVQNIQMPSVVVELVGYLETEMTRIREVAEKFTRSARPAYAGPEKETAEKAIAGIDLCAPEIVYGKFIDLYAKKLYTYLDQRLKFPLVNSQTRIFDAPSFKLAADQLLDKVAKDKKWFEGADAAVRSAAGADRLGRTFELMGDVFTVAQILHPNSAAKEDGDGLYVKRGFLKVEDKKILLADPGAPLAPPVETTVKEGREAEVKQGGTILIGGPEGGRKKIKPTQPVEFKVIIHQGLRENPPVPGGLPPAGFTSRITGWGLVPWLVSTTKRDTTVGGVTFSIEAVPDFPSSWPRRSTFGLTE